MAPKCFYYVILQKNYRKVTTIFLKNCPLFNTIHLHNSFTPMEPKYNFIKGLLCVQITAHYMQGLLWLRIVVANTLAKSKKLEPNEINLSQGFSQKVCFVFNSLPARGDLLHADNLYRQFGPRSDPTFCRA